MQEALCVHCQGNHISISGVCPIKKKKIEENKNKYMPKSFADIFDEKNFPPLKQKKRDIDFLTIINSDNKALNILVESIVKIVTLSKTKDTPICSKSVLDIVNETFKAKNISSSNSPTIS
ncbi:hypothetical protein O3G_MSEX000078 [Manduca sexta]|nr:hypothetical protein O3G_MSEX000078 [Manduca sexta]